MSTYDVAIAGAGLAGMAVALDMARAGQRVVLLERRTSLGGSIAVQETNLGTVDNCPHLFLQSFEHCLSRLDQLGTKSHLSAITAPIPLFQRAQWGTLQLAHPWHPLFGIFQKALPKGFVSSSLWMFRSFHAGETALQHLQRNGLDGEQMNFWREWGLSIFNADLSQCDAGLFRRTARALFLKRKAFQPLLADCSLDRLWIHPFRQALLQAGVEIRTASSVRDLLFKTDRLVGLRTRQKDVHAKRFVWAGNPWTLSQLPAMREHAPNFTKDTWHPKRGRSILHSICKVEPRATASPKMSAFFGMPYQWAFSHSENRVSLVASAVGAKHDGAEQSTQALHSQLTLMNLRLTSEPLHLRRQHATLLPDPSFESARTGNRSPISELYLCGAWTQTGLPLSMESALKSAQELTSILSQDLETKSI
jgi:hydroxysqualene dehydroxylase